jgi:hypothetical protein
MRDFGFWTLRLLRWRSLRFALTLSASFGFWIDIHHFLVLLSPLSSIPFAVGVSLAFGIA